MSRTCFIVPGDVLTRLAQDKELSAELRKTFFETAQISDEIRALRDQAAKLTNVMRVHAGATVELATAPMVTVYDCKHTESLPGTPVPNPRKSRDSTAKRTFNETTSAAKFYKDIFKRESMSDCFGSMFRQWEKKQDVNKADWLIGHNIMGPTAKARGFTCLRDMANPAAKHCLAPQPTQYSQITPGMDPHYSSGPPNLAFCTACKILGGKSWEKVGQVWYHSLTAYGPTPHMKMKPFADRTRQVAHTMYSGTAAVAAAVDQGWKHVGL